MKGGYPISVIQRARASTRYIRSIFSGRRVRFGNSEGFTIVEVMIVLAITGALFISAVALISGRQNRTEFQTSINNIKTQIQQAISEVQSGFYPSTNNLVCQVDGAGDVTFTSGGATQGSSQDCIFMGKVLQFGVASTDPQQFAIYSIAGRRQVNDKDVLTYAEARPAVMTTNDANPVNIPTQLEKLQYGLTVVPNSMTYANGGVTANIGAVGFLSTLNTFDTDKSGAQQVQLIPIQNTSLNMTPASAVTAINNNIATSPVSPDDGVSICFVSGGTNQSGLIKIGGAGRELSVTLTIKGNKTCS